MRCVTRSELCVGYREESDLIFQNETEKVIRRNREVGEPSDRAQLKWSSPSSWSQSSRSSHDRRARSQSPFRSGTPLSGFSSSSSIQNTFPWSTEAGEAHTAEQLQCHAEADGAVSLFFDRYVLYPCNDASTPGFLEHLPCLFKEVNVEGRCALRWAVKATALADVSRLDGWSASAANAAFDCYGAALSALRLSLTENGKIPDDYDLMTVVVLDIFEVTIGCSCQIPFSGALD